MSQPEVCNRLPERILGTRAAPAVRQINCDISGISSQVKDAEMIRPPVEFSIFERFQFSLKQGYRQCPESAEGVAG